MPNKASSHLHQLIRSLSGVENRYFKKFAARHSSKDKTQYLSLFEAINKQHVYDEEQIIQELYKSSGKASFSLIKNRLYHQILKSLDAFHAESSIDIELSYYIHYAEILFDKTLYDQCRRILVSAEKIAEKNEKWIALLQIIKRQKRLVEINNYEGAKGNLIEKLCKKEADTLRKLGVEAELWQRKSEVFSELFKRGQTRRPKAAKEIEAEIENIKKFAKKNADSFEAKYLAQHTQSAFFFSTGNYKACHKVLSENIELMESRMDIVKDDPTIYISALTNIIYISAKLNRISDVDRYLEKSRNLPGKLSRKLTNDLELRLFTNTYSLELAICAITGNIERGIAAISEVKNGLHKWDSKLSDVRKGAFYHAVSAIFLINSDFKKALFWNNMLLDTIPIEKSEDQYCFGKIMHIIIQYDMGNYDVIPHNLKSLKRQIDQRKRKHKFERKFIDFISEIAKAGVDEQHTKIFQKFSDELSKIETDPQEKIAFEYFDFKSWVDAKLLGRPMSVLLTERAPGKNIL